MSLNPTTVFPPATPEGQAQLDSFADAMRSMGEAANRTVDALYEIGAAIILATFKPAPLLHNGRKPTARRKGRR